MALLQTQYAVTQRVCALNNHGVKYLCHGSMSTAYSYFTEALETAKDLIQFSRQQVKMNGDLEDSTSGHCFTYSPCENRCLKAFVKRETSIYFCDRPLVLSPGLCASKDSQPISSLCSLVLFNMALIHHALGLHQECAIYLQKAASLYERCILVARVNKSTPRSNNTAVLIAASARNNMAQLALEHGNIEVARQYLEELGTICRCRSFESCKNVLHKNEWVNILSSVLLRDGLTAARAA